MLLHVVVRVLICIHQVEREVLQSDFLAHSQINGRVEVRSLAAELVLAWLLLSGSLHEFAWLDATVVPEGFEDGDGVVCEEAGDDEASVFVYLALSQKTSRKAKCVALQSVPDS